MLSGIVSFLFGEDAPKNILDESVVNYNIREDEDWVLVETLEPSKQVEESNQVKCNPSFSTTCVLPALSIQLLPVESGACITPPASPSHMEGSWYVTPPPCFTSGGPIHVEMSPLENLLIEHPSMSVYGSAPVPSLHTTAQYNISHDENAYLSSSNEHLVQSEDQLLPVSRSLSPSQSSVSSSSSTSSRVVEHVSRTPRLGHNQSFLLPIKRGVLEQIEILRPTQQAQKWQEQRKLKPSMLDRQNRVYFYQKSAKNPHRKDRWLNNSRVSNNRRC